MQDLYPTEQRRCYACIQWQGTRTYDPEKKLIKVDLGKEGNCLVKQAKVKGSSACTQFFPLH